MTRTAVHKLESRRRGLVFLCAANGHLTENTEVQRFPWVTGSDVFVIISEAFAFSTNITHGCVPVTREHDGVRLVTAR